MKTYQLLATTMLATLAGCTSRLEMQPLKPLVEGKQAADTIPNGVPYSLYYDRYSISVTYRISDCDELTLEVEPTVSEVVAEPDPDQTYVLNPNSLAGPLKTSTVTLEYHPDGSVASINAKAEDRTAETVGSLAKSAAGLVKIFAPAGGGREAKKPGKCKDETRKAFNAYWDFSAKKEDKIGSRVAGKNGELIEAKDAIDRAQTDFDTAKAKLDASDGLVSDPVQTQFNNAYLALEGATKRLAAAKKQLAKLAKPISVTHEFIWPDSGSATTGTLDTPPELLAVLPTWGGNVDVNNGFYNLAVTLRSSQPGGMGANVGLGMLDHKALARGIPYRSPARGTLAIATAFFDENNKPIEPETVFEKVYMVRQLGRVFQLPCVSKPFTSISCSLAFDAKGQLTKAGTENTKAPLEGAAGLLGSLVESGGSATDSLRAGAEKRAGAATKAKQDELAELELEAKLTAARRAQSSAGGTAAQQAKEAKILEYETDLKLINAQRALAEGQSQVTK